MPTPHNQAPVGAFAKVVLMPGDPLRAKWIAETFLHDTELVNNVRGVQGYTGYTKNGKRISVMASGMGMPSIGIYSHELFSHYGVEIIMRIGTSGSYSKDVHLGEVVLAQGASTDSSWAAQFGVPGSVSALADFELLETAYNEVKKRGLVPHAGNVFSSDHFYTVDKDIWKKWANLGCLCVEMESYALYMNATLLGKKALCLLTISDSFVEEGILTPEQRQTGLVDMIEVAIATAEKYL